MASVAYAVLVVPPVIMQVGLIFGAPWGAYAMGGQNPGRFGPALRVSAAVQGLLLVGMAVVMLDQGGVVSLDLPRGLGWASLALIGVSTVLNWITPSKAERQLWGPVMLGQLVTASTVMVLGMTT